MTAAALPALPTTADARSITDRVNVLIRDHNARRSGTIPVASLPAEPGIGEKWMVSDANSTTFNAIVGGGGANVIGVRWDGTNWRVC